MMRFNNYCVMYLYLFATIPAVGLFQQPSFEDASAYLATVQEKLSMPSDTFFASPSEEVLSCQKTCSSISSLEQNQQESSIENETPLHTGGLQAQPLASNQPAFNIYDFKARYRDKLEEVYRSDPKFKEPNQSTICPLSECIGHYKAYTKALNHLATHFNRLHGSQETFQLLRYCSTLNHWLQEDHLFVFQCIICGQTADDSKEYTAHLMTHADAANKIKCPIAECACAFELDPIKLFSRSSSSFHIKFKEHWWRLHNDRRSVFPIHTIFGAPFWRIDRAKLSIKSVIIPGKRRSQSHLYRPLDKAIKEMPIAMDQAIYEPSDSAASWQAEYALPEAIPVHPNDETLMNCALDRINWQRLAGVTQHSCLCCWPPQRFNNTRSAFLHFLRGKDNPGTFSNRMLQLQYKKLILEGIFDYTSLYTCLCCDEKCFGPTAFEVHLHNCHNTSATCISCNKNINASSIATYFIDLNQMHLLCGMRCIPLRPPIESLVTGIRHNSLQDAMTHDTQLNSDEAMPCISLETNSASSSSSSLFGKHDGF